MSRCASLPPSADAYRTLVISPGAGIIRGRGKERPEEREREEITRAEFPNTGIMPDVQQQQQQQQQLCSSL